MRSPALHFNPYDILLKVGSLNILTAELDSFVLMLKKLGMCPSGQRKICIRVDIVSTADEQVRLETAS